MSWISNYIHCSICDLITHPCPNFYATRNCKWFVNDILLVIRTYWVATLGLVLITKFSIELLYNRYIFGNSVHAIYSATQHRGKHDSINQNNQNHEQWAHVDQCIIDGSTISVFGTYFVDVLHSASKRSLGFTKSRIRKLSKMLLWP